MQLTVWLEQRLSSRIGDNLQDKSSRSDLMRAILVLVTSTFLTKTADTLANPKITLTALLQSLGAPVQLISLLVPLRESGALLPQVWLAGFVLRAQRIAPLYSMGTLIQGLAAFGMMLSAWKLEGQLAGWAIVVCLAVLSLARALCSIAYKAVLGAHVPGGLRGQTTGWASSAAGLAAILIALILIAMPDSLDNSILVVFLGVAAATWWFASALFLRIEENNENPTPDIEKNLLERILILRDKPEFRRFVFARSLLVSTALVAPWYVMLTVKGNGLLSSVGALILASGLASFVSSPIWGRYSDRSSRWVLQISAMCVAVLGGLTFTLHSLNPELFTTLWLVPCLYFLLEISHQGVRVGRKTYVVDLADDGNRVDYVSISNTFIGVIILLMGIVSGVLAVWLSPINMIVMFSCLAAIGSWFTSSLQEALDN